jgi:hypothetical protein
MEMRCMPALVLAVSEAACEITFALESMPCAQPEHADRCG